MIHWTVRNNTSRTHRSSANAHLFKLIITHDNKSVDQIERVYIWCCSFQGRTSSSSAREKDRWYYLIKKNEIGPARDARQRVSVILQLSIIPLDSIYSPFRSSTTSWAPNGIEAQRSEWENFKVEEWNRYTHTHALRSSVVVDQRWSWRRSHKHFSSLSRARLHVDVCCFRSFRPLLSTLISKKSWEAVTEDVHIHFVFLLRCRQETGKFNRSHLSFVPIRQTICSNEPVHSLPSLLSSSTRKHLKRSSHSVIQRLF